MPALWLLGVAGPTLIVGGVGSVCQVMPPRACVICPAELGPVAAKAHCGEKRKLGPYRATFEPTTSRAAISVAGAR